MSAKDVMVFIDPSYRSCYNNELFKTKSKMNRDGQFAPFIFLKEKLAEKGIPTNTADYLVDHRISGGVNIYVSLGITTNYIKLSKRNNVRLQSFYVMEPPIVAPHLYRELNMLTNYFDRVYVHNTEGVGFETHFSNQLNLRKFFWPQAKDKILENLWENEERKFLVMISSNKKPYVFGSLPRLKSNELYSERIRALVALQSLGTVDLYGHGWDVPYCKIPFYPYLYWKNRKVLKAICKGPVESKYETLSRYTFALCFENMTMPGYITEKIFDCFFVGTIPIYLGASDVEKYIPKNCFIDMRDFNDYGELRAYLLGLSDDDVFSFRATAREYLSSEQYQPFTKERFVEQFEMDLMETLKSNGIRLPLAAAEVVSEKDGSETKKTEGKMK